MHVMYKRHKRKSINPRRSPTSTQPSDETSSNRRIVLDVYEIYKKAPHSLLYKPVAVVKKRIVTNGLIRAQFREAKRLASDEVAPEPSVDGDKFKTLFKGQKTLPDELRQNVKINMAKFKVTSGVANVTWKGTTLDIPDTCEFYDDITKEELMTCKILRIFPAQYLHIKETMLKQVMKGPFKKRDAQAWFRIDVNKTNRYDITSTIYQ